MVSTATDRLSLSTDPATAVKAPCRVATTANLTLFGLQTVNGVALAAYDRVLVKDQVDATANGIYIATTTAWIRAKDFDGARDAVTGTIVWIVEGSTNPGTFYRLTTANPVVFGTSSIGFSALDIFAALLPQVLTALNYPRVTSDATAYELRTPAQALSDLGADNASNLASGTVANARLTSLLQAFTGLTGASDLLAYFTGSAAMATTALTSLARTLIGRATATLMRGDLGLGSIATQSAGAVAITGGSIDSATLTSVPSPSASTDAATKGYVDSALAGLGKRGAVRAASTVNVASLSGTTTIDGVALIAGDLVLLKDQSTQAQNGVYAIAAGAWSRDTNYDTWNELTGALIVVEEGSTQADFLYLCTSVSGGTLGTTAVTFSKVAPGSGGTVTNLTASNGIKTTGGLAITSTGNVELDVASQATAQAGTDNVQAMTALRVAQAIAALAISDPVVTAKSGDFTEATAVSNTLYVASAALVATLRAVATYSTGFRIRLKNATDGTAVSFASSDLIDGQAAFSVPGREEVELTMTGSTWTVTKRPAHKIGETLQWDSNILPEGGYAWKNGQALSRTTYSGLFKFLCPQAPITVTIASPGVVTHNAHGYSDNQPVVFRSSGALPTGLTAGTTYYVKSSSTNTYQLSATPGGSAINTSGSQSGTHTANYTAYGDGDGSTTFNVPDERGRAKYGKDDMGGASAANRITNAISSIFAIALGYVGGSQSMQAHTHTYTAALKDASPPPWDGSSNAGPGVSNDGLTTDSTGAGASQNMGPAIVTNFAVKT